MPYRYDNDSMDCLLLLFNKDNILTKLLKHDSGKLIYERERCFFNGFSKPMKATF